MQAAITGIGMVLPTGIGLQALWQHWDAQSPALRPYRSERIDSERIGYFGAVAPEDHAAAREAVPHKLRRYGTPTTHLGVLAATQALRHGGIAEVEADNDRWALFTAQGDYTSPSFATFERAVQARPRDAAGGFDMRQFTEETLNRRGIDPFAAIKGLSNNLLALVSLTHRFRGEGGAFVQNESAVHAALDAALFALRSGRCDLALVVAAGSYDEVWTLAEQARQGRLSHCARQERSLRSFDRSRDGTVLAEGAVALVLETAAHARRRGATPHAWITGLGCSAAPLGTPVPDEAYSRAAQRALRTADGVRLPHAGVDAVLADGKGTVEHDGTEMRLLRRLGLALEGGAGAPALPVTTVRPITGLVAAGGLMDVALAVSMLRHGCIPPVPGLDEPEDHSLGWVRTAPRAQALRRVLSCQHGFGGFCSAVVVDHADAHS